MQEQCFAEAGSSPGRDRINPMTGHWSQVHMQEEAASRSTIRINKVLADPERLELPTNWFEASYSIQLSYGSVGMVLPVGA